VDLDQVGAEGGGAESRKRRARVIRDPHRAAVALPQLREDVEPHLLRRARIRAGALEDGEGDPVVTRDLDRGVELLPGAHAAREEQGLARLRHPVEERVVGDLAGGHLPGRNVDALQQVDRLGAEGGREEEQVPLLGVLAEADPLGLGELHAPPVLESRVVLGAEADPPGLARRGLRRRDVRLELHRVGAGVRDRVDVGVRRAEAAVVRLRHLGDHQGARSAVVEPASHGVSSRPSRAT
jgi:hypothetical protein